MDYMPYAQMMNPGLCQSPMMEQPVESLESMYPEIYHRVHPKVRHMCMCMDNPGNPDMYPFPTRAAVEGMTDNIYNEILAEMGEMQDGCEHRGEDRQFIPYGAYGAGYGYPGYGFGFGGRRFLRDLVGILLIRELLGRRGFFY